MESKNSISCCFSDGVISFFLNVSVMTWLQPQLNWINRVAIRVLSKRHTKEKIKIELTQSYFYLNL